MNRYTVNINSAGQVIFKIFVDDLLVSSAYEGEIPRPMRRDTTFIRNQIINRTTEELL